MKRILRTGVLVTCITLLLLISTVTADTVASNNSSTEDVNESVSVDNLTGDYPTVLFLISTITDNIAASNNSSMADVDESISVDNLTGDYPTDTDCVQEDLKSAMTIVDESVSVDDLTGDYPTDTACVQAALSSSTITVGKSGSVNYLTSKYSTDTACIQAALNAAKSGDTIQISSGKYNITKQISQQNKDLRIVGVGNVTFDIKTGVASQPAVYFYGRVIKTANLAADASKGKTQIVLSDASNLQKSDLIQIWKNVKWCPKDYSEQKTGEMYLVESVSGNTVTLNQPLIRDYKKSESSTARIYRPIRIQIENIKFQNQNPTGDLEGLGFKYCKDSSITNCSFDDNGQASIRLFTCYNVEVKKSSISDSCRSGRGYGVSIADATAYVNIHDNKLSNCRHCIMSGTGNFEALNRNITITNNTFVGSSVADANVIDAHPMTIDYTVTKNTVYPKPGFYAFYDGTLESVFSDNKVYGGGGVKRRGSVENGKHIIKNNYIEGGNLYQSTGTGAGDTLLITGNSNKNGIYGVSLANENFRKVTIDKNTFNGISENGIFIVKSLNPDMNITISNNKISNVKKNGMLVRRDNVNNKMNLVINNNIITEKNLLAQSYCGIYIYNVLRANVGFNQIADSKGTYTIREGGSSDWNIIHNNSVDGYPNSIIKVGSNTILKNNRELGVINENHAPVINTVSSQTVTEGSTLTFNVKATDSDGDKITYSVAPLPSGAYFNSSSGVFRWIPGEGKAGTYGLTFTASDGKLSDSTGASINVLKKGITVAADNRLRQASPSTVYENSAYIDVGGQSNSKYRDIMRFDLSGYKNASQISGATLSLYWYYPAGSSRPNDTVIEVYRPASAWNSSYVSWNNRDKGIAWKNAGGDWYDKKGISQGNTPYATFTIKGSTLPNNKYYELNVTDLVKEYASGKYANTGFLIKARTESNNYIAFYSSDCGNKTQAPKLEIK